MSRTERCAIVAVVVALAVGLGGCMRIYPDPELPDVEVEWFTEFECQADDEIAVLTLSERDSGAERGTVTVPCKDGVVRFDDVARVRYRLAAHLEDAAGTLLSEFETEFDLRDGHSERVDTYFSRVGGLFRVAWTFDVGVSCESLAVTSFLIAGAIDDGPEIAYFQAPCEDGVYTSRLPLIGLVVTLKARAFAGDRVVASSPPSLPLMQSPGVSNDFGTLTLSPCDADCL